MLVKEENMRKAILIVLLAAICLLGGCGSSAQVEDQAYVIAMGIDRTDDGGIELSVQIPKISGGQLPRAVIFP